MPPPSACPEPSQWQELLDGALPEQTQEGLNRHLESCPRCRETLEGLVAQGPSWRNLALEPGPHQPAPDPALVRVMEELKADAGFAETQAEPPGDHDLPPGFLEPSDKPGQLGRLDHYEVLEVIGRGGMGVVLKAFDERLHRMVAVKVMAPQFASSASARKRFIREAQAAAAVRDEHVVGIHAVAEANGLPYLAMEYVAGVSLQERLDRGGPLTMKEILRIGMQTAAGLAAAHAQGLIHRDIKPANILLENGVERVKITDFGLARAVDDASLTQSGLIAGTPQYMAPEQAKGEAVDHRADLFSLGSVLYAMCTGRAPFRAETTMAVLKRVCEDTPRPIRDVHPETPDWLITIIDKLHAKDPAERFQTAAEVADVLGQYLTHLQQPSLAPMPVGNALRGVPGVGRNATEGVPYRGRRRWAVAAAVLILLIGGLGLTDATGVTQVVPTVIRIVTGEGTLVVEVDDPGIRVQIDGEDLTITGAGLHELRLRPGNYQLEASKDGKPVHPDRELVTITRGGKQVVRVRLEGEVTATVAAPEAQAFVVLGGEGVAERKFDTLAEAVQGASDGDTIEVRGNGPFNASEPIRIVTNSLTIRAGKGYRPVIKLNPNLQTGAPLVLEGLELHRLDGKPPQQGYHESLVFSWGASSLHVANCRFFLDEDEVACIAGDSPRCVLRNCEFVCPNQTAVYWTWYRGKLFLMDNCLQIGRSTLQFGDSDGFPRPETSLHLRRNTLIGSAPGLLIWDIEESRTLEKADVNRVMAEASATIFDAPSVLLMNHLEPYPASIKSVPLSQAAELLLRGLAFRDRGNLYAPGSSNVSRYTPELVTLRPQNVADWKQFWGTPDGEAIEGRVRYQGGDLLARLANEPDKLTPEDFRLRPDSAGYRAGLDGKDLGADVDLVGPGPAYERWKKTPEYQEWLADTGQAKVDVPQAERQAFVVLGGEGVAERKFDTLAEAVQTASDGDTIEVRGNGPFVTQAMHLGKQALTIRAGKGFRPLIRFAPGAGASLDHSLGSDGPLVLEGLEFERIPQDLPNDVEMYEAILSSVNAPLYVANCRFIPTKRYAGFLIYSGSPVCEVRNCELLCPAGNSFGPDLYSGQQRFLVDNCLQTPGGISFHYSGLRDAQNPASIQLTRNTTVSSTYSLAFWLVLDKAPDLADPDRGVKLLRVQSEWNIFDATSFVLLNQPYDELVRASGEAQAFFAQRVGWHGQRNLYALDGPFLRLSASVAGQQVPEPATPIKGLAEWKDLSGSSEANSMEGRVRYQGGDLMSKLATAAEKLTPDDFRLRPDSAGYRAGPDGKDLGANVDLVGPGPAYERWKKTPEYQQWLKETGQSN